MLKLLAFHFRVANPHRFLNKLPDQDPGAKNYAIRIGTGKRLDLNNFKIVPFWQCC